MDMDQAGVDPQRWNRYAYVSNKPLRFVDPDGRQQQGAAAVQQLAPLAPLALPLVATPVGLAIVGGAIIITGAALGIKWLITTVSSDLSDLNQALTENNNNLADGAGERGKTTERPFTDQLKDFNKNPQDWVKTPGEPVKATRRGARQTGTSTVDTWTNTKTGERISEHTVRDDKGKIVDGPHKRPRKETK